MLAVCCILRLAFRSALVFAVLNVVTVLALGGTIPAFFLATGPIVTSRNGTVYDGSLVEADEMVLGAYALPKMGNCFLFLASHAGSRDAMLRSRFYPQGQLSLFLDQSPTLNPSTAVGRTYTEILQLFYVSYYAWGGLPFFFLLFKYAYSHNWRSREDGFGFETVESARYLTELKLYLCGWMSAFFITFLINRAFPAKSPRLYLRNEYEHPLEGWGLASSLIGMATDDSSFGSFPSGHFNQTLVCAMFAMRLSKTLGVITFVAAAGIALATQALRYHYFVDIVVGLLVAALAITFGLNWTELSYRSQVDSSLKDFEARQALLASLPERRREEGDSICSATDCCMVPLDTVDAPDSTATEAGVNY